MKVILSVSALAIFTGLGEIRAAQLMSEPFAGAGYTLGAGLSGRTGGTGFGGAWTETVVGSGSSLTIGSGLTFSDYAVSGNALTVSIGQSGFGGLAAGSRDIGDVSMPALGGELWVSYLYKYIIGGTGGDDARVSIRDSGGTNDRFILTGRDDLLELNGGVGIDSSDEGGTNNIQTGNVILLIARFLNFGAGSAVTPQTGTFWALRPQDYDAIKAGGITVAELNGNAFSTGSDNPVTTPISYTTANIVAVNGTIGAGSAGFRYSVDELRWGTDLTSVLIPEPGTSALFLFGAVAVGAHRRRRDL